MSLGLSVGVKKKHTHTKTQTHTDFREGLKVRRPEGLKEKNARMQKKCRNAKQLIINN